MSFRLLLPLVLLAFSTAVNAQVQLKPNTTKAEEHKTYHLPSIRPMPAAMRLEHYRKRQQMEAASPFLGVKWRPIGPEIQGGRVIEIKVPRNQPNTMFCAYATGGLWKSSDQGVTWTSLFENESAFAIGSIDVTADGRTIWIGTGENNSQRTSYSGTGMFKSSDAGATWQHMGLAETHRIGRVIIDPKNPNTVYVGAIGALYSQNPERGVFKTTDGGRTWSHVLKLDDYTGVIDMAMDPRNPSVIYASSWERDRRAWNFREGGAGSTIYKTVDGGKTWSELKNGLPKRGEIGRIGLAVSGSRPDTVYAFYDNQGSDEDTLFHDESQPTGTLTARRFALLNEEQFVAIDTAVLNRFASAYLPQGTKVEEIVQKIKAKTMTLKDVADLIEKRNPAALRQVTVEAEVYRSDDGGKSWRRTHARRLGEHGGYYGGRVIVNPHNPDDLLITGVLMLRSRDGGKTWSSVATQVHVDHHAYWIDPTNPNNHAIGNDGGLYLSFDDGKNWRHMNNMNVGQFTTIAVDNKLPYNVYGGLQDNGTLKGPSTYVFGRNRIHDWSAIGGGDGSALAVDPRDDGDLVYGAWQFGMHYAINQKTNQRWNLRPSAKTGEPALRFNWISPILISPHHPDIIYLGSQKLHRSMSQGRAWEDLSGDLTKNLPNGDVPFSTLKDISESPFKFGLIYVGADDGTVKMTKDHGATWEDISTPAKDRWVMRVIASKWDAATVYVAQNGYRQDDWTPYLWKSTDYGTTWTSIAGNLPFEPINVVREDPNKKGILYVGTDLGVFVTFDGGKNWEPLSGGIPRTPVHDIAIQARDEEMVIASHARSVWALKLKPIYTLEGDKSLREKDIHIWPLESMTRNRRWGYDRQGDWDMSNPEPPKLRGQVWTKEPGKGSVRIKTKDGKVLKEKEMEFFRGFNNFEIDLRTFEGKRGTVDPKKREIKTVEDVLKDPFEAERSQFLPAGEYVVEISVAGKSASVDWKLSD